MTDAAQTLTDALRNIYTHMQGGVETLRNVITQCASPNLLTHCDLNGQVSAIVDLQTAALVHQLILEMRDQCCRLS